MRWTAKESSIYFNERDYVDTVLIPLNPITFEKGGIEAANSSEFIDLVAKAIENQFKGRILLLPPFMYFHSSESELERLYEYWSQQIESGYFKHIIYITSDPFWQKIISKEFKVIWVPSVPLQQMDKTTKMNVVRNQAEQIIPIIINYWQEVEKRDNLQKK